MAKYGFDYFVKRGEILSEMANIDKRLVNAVPESNVGSLAYDLRNQVGKIMKVGGVTNSDGFEVAGFPQNVRQNRVLRYFLYMASRMDETADVDPMEDDADGYYEAKSSEEIGHKAKELVGIPEGTPFKKFVGENGEIYPNMGRLYSGATVKAIQNDPEYISSPEFKEKLLDPTNIADYMSKGRVAAHSIYSVAKAKQQEELFNAPIEDVHSSQMGIKEIVGKIHRAIGYEKMKKSPNTQEPTPSKKVDNNFTGNVDNILESINQWITVKSAIDKIVNAKMDLGGDENENTMQKLSYFNDNVLGGKLPVTYIASLALLPRDKIGNTLLEDLYEQFEDLKETGISVEDFQQEIEDMKSYLPEPTHPTLELILNDIIQAPASTESNEFPGYDEKILNEFLKTPEDVEGFRKWYKWYKIQLVKELEISKERKAAKKSEFKSEPGEIDLLRRNYIDFLERWKKINKDNAKKYADSLRVDDPEGDKLMKHYNISPEDIGDDHMASKVRSTHGESYVMNYMTEQVQKDNLNKPKGEFKDRGFKKPTNYSHGRV